MQIIHTIAVSQVGKVREHNEDALFFNESAGLWLVADGMGGHASGEVASELAIKTVSSCLQTGENIKLAIESAHKEILHQGQLNPEQKGMGTTIVAAQLKQYGFNIGWVGDSRAYCYDKKLTQLTTDHTFVQDMVYREVFTPEEAEIHVQRNLINRSLGMENGLLKVDACIFKPKKSGYLLLCSDGVSDYANRETLQSVFKQHSDIKNLADAITTQVLSTEAGDNFSFILVEFTVSLLRKWRNRLAFLG